MCPYYLDGDQTEPARVRPVIPVATRAYRVRVAVATVQFSRAVREGCAHERRHDGRRRATRSLKTQQHARARARRYAARGALGRHPKAAIETTRGRPHKRLTAGPARFGRRARPHGRRPALPDRSRPKWRAGRAAPCRTGTVLVLPRKEVIQPHLPVRLPCYDFTPVTSPTFDGSLPCGLGHRLRVLLTPVV